ncbi:MAG: cysteine hydrolase [Clostridiales bacterium]|jgi:nicotinamidase-related amidase|nr:cysteine hydrolase [Clostridiales bacterium]
MFEKKILIIVDYQTDFVTGSLKVPGAAALESGIAERVEKAYADGDKVVFLKDTHPKSYLQTREGRCLPVGHCIIGTEGHELYGKVKALENRHGSSTLDKLQFGCLDIPRLLRGEQIRPAEFVLAGLATEICVISNALILKAQFREVPVKIESALCAGLTPEGQEAALAVARACQVEIV